MNYFWVAFKRFLANLRHLTRFQCGARPCTHSRWGNLKLGASVSVCGERDDQGDGGC